MNSATPRMSISDADIRLDVIDATRSFIVQAPAGSGKTELLIQRFLTLLAEVDDPTAVLAITFTRKAATEMRNRVLAALESASEPEPDETHKLQTWEIARAVMGRDAERDWQLLDDPSLLNIRTLDSLCEQVVGSEPFRARFGSRFSIADDREPLYREAARRTILKFGGADAALNSALEELLDAADASAATLETLIAEMLPTRDQWIPLIENRGENREHKDLRAKLEKSLRDAVESELALIRETFARALGNNVETLLEFAAFAATNVNGDHELAPLRRIASLPGATYDDLAPWNALRAFCFTQDHSFRKALNKNTGFPTSAKEQKDDCICFLEKLAGSKAAGDLCAAAKRLTCLPPATYSDDEWHRVNALFAVLPVANTVLQSVFAERGESDFIEVSRAALVVLQAGETSRFADRVRHILVDEFQDTSVMQVDLLAALMSGWKSGDGRTLFLVGDPMQSIYGFRKAEVTLFGRAAQNTLALNAELNLRAIRVNFRSQAGLVEWFNGAFPAIMTATNEVTGAVPYSPAEAIHPTSVPAVEVVAFNPGDRRSEAEFIAQTIEAEQKRHAKDSNRELRIAILVRSRSHLAEIIPALRRHAISFRAVDIEQLAERPAVRDLEAIARAILHVGDRTSWLALLRAPFCGLTLADLNVLCGDDHQRAILDLCRERLAQLSPDAQSRLNRVLPILELAIANRGRMPLRALLERTWTALGGPAAVRAGEDGDSDLRDAASFFEFLDSNEVAGSLPNDRTMSDALKKLFAPAEPVVGVDIMTIHGAKGLEFDLVFVPGLARIPRGNTRELLDWRERVVNGDRDLLLSPFDALSGRRKDDATIGGYIRRLRKDCAREEAKRLVYVATTRARKRLILTYNDPKPAADGTATPNRDTFLGIMHEVDAFRSLATQGPTANIAKATGGAKFRRLRNEWQLPEIAPPLPRTRVAADEAEHTFEWVGYKQRAIGTVTHRVLQQIGRDGLDHWNEHRIQDAAPSIRAALASQSVNAADLRSATDAVLNGLNAILADDKGRWILASHAEAQCEFALSGVENEGVSAIKIDRTFIDADGTRWIIDYKMATLEGGSRDAFIASQVEKYRPDVERYARIVAGFDSRPVRLGLYFPLLREFREVKN